MVAQYKIDVTHDMTCYEDDGRAGNIPASGITEGGRPIFRVTGREWGLVPRGSCVIEFPDDRIQQLTAGPHLAGEETNAYVSVTEEEFVNRHRQ